MTATVAVRSDHHRRLLALAKHRAKTRGIPFALTEQDIDIPVFCPVLGLRLKRGTGKGPIDSSPTLDRIDNSHGYVPGNVLVVSARANRLKGDAGWSELARIAGFYQQIKD